MRTRRLLLLLVCLCVAGCPKKSAAQTAAYTRQFTVTSTAGRPVPGAKVYVCTGSVTVNTAVTPPCTPAATIYSDFALSTPITQPNIADAFGNVLYYVPAGTYTEVIVGNGITPSSVVLNFPSGGGATNLGQLNGGTSPSGQTYDFSPSTVTLPHSLTIGSVNNAVVNVQGSSSANFFLSNSANPATAGSLRLAATDGINWRNAGNTGNLSLIPDSLGNLTWPGGATFGGNLTVNNTIKSSASQNLTLQPPAPGFAINLNDANGINIMQISDAAHNSFLGALFPTGVSSLDDIGAYANSPATSSVNVGSPALGNVGNFWTGTQSNQEIFNNQLIFGTGANPTVNESFGFSATVAGSTGQHSFSFSRGAGLTGQGTPWKWILPTDTFGITFNHALTANRPVSWPDFAGSVAIASGPFNLNDCLAVAAIDAGGFPQIGDAGPCGSGGGSPGGTNTAVQFNNSSAFGGDATNFNFNPTTHALTITGAMHTQNSSFVLSQLVDGSFQGDTICADNTLTWNDCIGGVGGRTVTTTSDTLVSGDRQQMVTYNSASAVAVSIASAASLGNNFITYLRDINAGTETITPTTSTINGSTSATITEGEHCTLSSQDNTNYILDCSLPLTAGANITITPSAFGASIASTGGSGGLSGMTAGQIPVAATATTVTSSKALAGTDSSIATTAGSLTNGALACGDSLGGVTTTGCTAGTGPNELNLTSVTGNMTATTTPTNVTGISMSVLANTTYIGQCFLQTSASAGTTQITWTGPASPTAVSFSGTLNASMGTAFGTLVNGASSTTRQAQATVFYLENGANAGSIQLQFQNSSTGTSTMYAGSYCIIHQKGAN